MIKLEITDVHTVLDDQIRDLLRESVDKLERYIPKHARQSAHAQANLKQVLTQGNKKATAEIILHLPHEILTAKESTLTMPEAIGLVENKLVTQLKKYKEKHANPKLLRRLSSRLRRQS